MSLRLKGGLPKESSIGQQRPSTFFLALRCAAEQKDKCRLTLGSVEGGRVFLDEPVGDPWSVTSADYSRYGKHSLYMCMLLRFLHKTSIIVVNF